MQRVEPVKVVFYSTGTGREPVREWLRGLSSVEKKLIGEDIKTLQFGWPLGMPLVEKLDQGLWQIRITLKEGIGRVLFTVHGNNIVLLHGFMKKSRKIRRVDIDVARERMRDIRRG